MALYLFDVFGNASIGVYSLVNDKIAIVPPQVPEPKRHKIEEWLKVKVVATTVGKSLVNGAMACSNSNGILLPSSATDDEIEAIESAKLGLNVAVMDTKRTAYGNMVLANDKGAVVDPRLSPETMAKVSDTLGVEVVHGEIAGLPYVATGLVANSYGAMVGLLTTGPEMFIIGQALDVVKDND